MRTVQCETKYAYRILMEKHLGSVRAPNLMQDALNAADGADQRLLPEQNVGNSVVASALMVTVL
jgi:hypothetical protein